MKGTKNSQVLKGFFALLTVLLFVIGATVFFSVKHNQNFATEATDMSSTTESTVEKIVPDKSVALTFDDGPRGETTNQLLDILKEKQVPATFFVLGNKVELFPEVVQRAASEGHEIASHTYDHQDLTKLTAEQVEQELRSTDQLILAQTKQRPKSLRPPYGSINPAVAQIANRPIVQWSVDSMDWQSKNTEAIVAQVKANVKDGSIILFHDIYQETITAMPQIIDYLLAEGYALKTVDDLLGQPEQVKNYFSLYDQKDIS